MSLHAAVCYQMGACEGLQYLHLSLPETGALGTPAAKRLYIACAAVMPEVTAVCRTFACMAGLSERSAVIAVC